MHRVGVRQRLVASPAARLVTLPARVGSVARFNATSFSASARWLVRSREHTNYTYDLTQLNLVQLAWFVSGVAKRPIEEVLEAINEVTGDNDLVRHVLASIESSPRRRTMDRSVRLGRRLGWYALVRLLTPEHVVETGTDKGLGTCVLAAALLRNGTGRVTTIDASPIAGALISGPYAAVVDRQVGDSVDVLGSLRDVDFFIHDSDHSPEHERRELLAIAPHLAPSALVLSDNSHATEVLPRWAEETGRQFAFFAEQPADHWYSGAGIGAVSSG